MKSLHTTEALARRRRYRYTALRLLSRQSSGYSFVSPARPLPLSPSSRTILMTVAKVSGVLSLLALLIIAFVGSVSEQAAPTPPRESSVGQSVKSSPGAPVQFWWPFRAWSLLGSSGAGGGVGSSDDAESAGEASRRREGEGCGIRWCVGDRVKVGSHAASELPPPALS